MNITRISVPARLAVGAMLVAACLAGPYCSKDAPDYTQSNKTESGRQAGEKAAPGTMLLQFFYGNECPHCNRIKPEVESLGESFPGLQVKKYEVWHNVSNQDLLAGQLEGKKRIDAPGKTSTAQGVPTTIVGDEYYVGSDMNIIRSMVVRSLKKAGAGSGL
jgi:hypothetical protein